MRGPATPRRAGPKSLSRTRVSLALALVAARLAHTPLTQPGAVRPASVATLALAMSRRARPCSSH